MCSCWISSRTVLLLPARGCLCCPSHFFLPLSAWKSISPQCCLTPWGLDVLGGTLGTCWRRVLGFFSIIPRDFLSFGRLDWLQPSLQLLFVTDFIPSIAFLLLLEAEARMFSPSSLGFPSLSSSLREGLCLRVPFSSRGKSRFKEGSREWAVKLHRAWLDILWDNPWSWGWWL